MEADGTRAALAAVVLGVLLALALIAAGQTGLVAPPGSVTPPPLPSDSYGVLNVPVTAGRDRADEPAGEAPGAAPRQADARRVAVSTSPGGGLTSAAGEESSPPAATVPASVAPDSPAATPQSAPRVAPPGGRSAAGMPGGPQPATGPGRGGAANTPDVAAPGGDRGAEPDRTAAGSRDAGRDHKGRVKGGGAREGDGKRAKAQAARAAARLGDHKAARTTAKHGKWKRATSNAKPAKTVEQPQGEGKPGRSVATHRKAKSGKKSRASVVQQGSQRRHKAAKRATPAKPRASRPAKRAKPAKPRRS